VSETLCRVESACKENQGRGGEEREIEREREKERGRESVEEDGEKEEHGSGVNASHRGSVVQRRRLS
jgi:hypothetical protein